MKGGQVMMSLAALVAGGALGYAAALLTNGPMVPATPVRQETARTRSIAAADGAEIEVLRARIHELEKQLVTKGGDEASGPAGVAEETPGADEPPAHESFRDRLARMEKEDPVRFAQMTNRMAQGHRRHVERQQAKLDFLSSIDTSRLGEKARRVHEDLQDAIVARDALEQKMFDPDLTDARRRELMDEMRELSRKTSQLNTRERNNLMAAAVKAVGIKGEKSKELVSTIRDIIEATDGGGRQGFGGPPPGPPPGR